jgi:NADPH:quinone reductase-like Zn-dependent oxidoreductase
LVQSLGANKVFDYAKKDFLKDGNKYDFIYDAVGKISFFKCAHLLKNGGIFISSDLGFMAQNIFLPMITPIIKPLIGNKKTVPPSLQTEIKETLSLIKSLIEQDRFKAVIDRKFTLERIIDAYKYVEKGQKIGNVVITVKHSRESHVKRITRK